MQSTVKEYGKSKLISKQVYIQNIPYEGTSTELKKRLLLFGNVISCRIVFDKKTNTSKGYVFALFENSKSASKACKASDRVCRGEESKYEDAIVWSGRKLRISHYGTNSILKDSNL